MNISVVIPTRGDIDLDPVLSSFPPDWETVVYDNGAGKVLVNGKVAAGSLPDLAVYARYEAIRYAEHDLILTQDDDVIVSDPQAIVDAWVGSRNQCAEEQFDPALLWHLSGEEIRRIAAGEHVTANMPAIFRQNYSDACLVGFGSCFHRDAPQRAFDRFFGPDARGHIPARDQALFHRECDRLFTVLTPRVLVDVPKEDREMASDPDRLWRDPEHNWKTKKMLGLARAVRDA